MVRCNLALWIKRLDLKENEMILILVGSMERIMVIRLGILAVDLELIRINLVMIVEEVDQ